MPTINAASENQLQLEGATLAAVKVTGDSVRLEILGAGIYHEDYLELFEASLVVVGSDIPDHLALPSEITDVLITLPGVGSWGVFVTLPFSISGHCQVQVSFLSGESVTVRGVSCHIELGHSTCHAYTLEPHNGT